MATQPTTWIDRINEQVIRTPALREVYDLLALIGAGLLLPALLVLPVPLLRVPLGVAAVLLAPGYALTAALFPRRDEMGGAARAALSFGLSAAIIPLLALVLDALPGGIQPLPIALVLLVWITLWAGVALLRRALVAPHAAAQPPLPNAAGWWRGLNSARRWQYALGTATIALVLGAGALALALPDPSAQVTEFYALGRGGLAEDYPREAVVGQPLSVTIGIANQERTAHRYRVEVWSPGDGVAGQRARLASLPAVELAPGARHEQPVTWIMPAGGADQQVQILLFADEAPAPYRQLSLWLNVVDRAR